MYSSFPSIKDQLNTIKKNYNFDYYRVTLCPEPIPSSARDCTPHVTEPHSRLSKLTRKKKRKEKKEKGWEGRES